MKLIVGLGNPGKEYMSTRHNIGFMFLDKYYADFKLNDKFKAMEKMINVNNERVLLIKPLSFMNLSGEVVIKYVQYYKIDVNDIYVIHDDMDMNLGKIKICYNHNSGGHNGIKNIIDNLGSKNFIRIKVGIGKNSLVDTVNYVLGKFDNDELKVINKSFAKMENIVLDITSFSVDRLMNKYNSME